MIIDQIFQYLTKTSLILSCIIMKQIEPLDYGKFYHIYNRGINSCNVFTETDNYQYFLNLYDKHISPVADTYAWVLMKNHFHFLVRIKELQDLTGFQNLSGLICDFE